jgi:hypothetical protein
VNAPIDLNFDLAFDTERIQDELPAGMLAAELQPGEAPPA